jgi:F-type H+-transporting ATPase subunit delta
MTNYKVATRYAASFLESAKSKNNLEAVSKDMEALLKVIHENRQLKVMIESPVIKPSLKISILDEIFSKRFDKDSLSFLNFIIKKNRDKHLLDIIRAFLNLRDEELGIINVDVTSAFELTPDQEKDLREKLENQFNKKIRFNFKIDKNLIGGFVAKIGDTVVDASLKHQLDLLRKQFKQGRAVLN